MFWYVGLSTFVDTFSSIWSLYDEKRATQLLLIALVLILVISSRNIRDNIARILHNTNWHTLISITLLVALALFSSLAAPLPIYALTETFTILGLAMLSLAIAAALYEKSNLIITVVVIATWAFILRYEIEFITSYIAAFIFDGRIKFELLFPRFGNVRFFNQFQIWLLPLSLAPLMILKIEKKIIIYSLYILSGLWITLLMASQSAGAQLAFLTALISTYIVYGKISKQLIKTTIIVVSIGISIYLILFLFIPNLVTFLSDDSIRSTSLIRVIENQESSQARLQLWKMSVDHIQESPFLGIGPMHYAYHPGQHAHPHNSALQISSEFGLPFFLLSTFLLVLFIRNWLQSSTQASGLHNIKLSVSAIYKSQLVDNQQIWIILFFSLISGLFYSMVSGVFVMPMSQTMMSILFGLMIGLMNTKKQLRYNRQSLLQSITIQITAGVLAIGLLHSVLPHLTTRVLNPFFANYLPAQTAGPRYWELGGLIQNPATNTSCCYEHPALTSSTIKSQN